MKDSGRTEAGTGLYDGFEGYRTATEAEYRHLLTDGLVIPDTNVFLNLYRYNEQTRSDLLTVLNGLGNRLWVPRQVMEEFGAIGKESSGMPVTPKRQPPNSQYNARRQ